MESIIQLLPDAIANQIAAGEVVQRPASVVKELLENAVDAGASRIDVHIKDAGKTLIQVSDNGSGMSAQDARMCFERHATSKIKSQKDLFAIRTLGFRGEALSSIAAVAQVRVRSRQREDELGTEVDIEGSEVKNQGPCAMTPGTTFFVKNLFFNVPARRNFLKSNPVETRHILNEFIRVAIPNTDIHFTFTHNTTQVYDLPIGTLQSRLTHLFGKDLNGQLAWLEEASGYVRISGFVGKPGLHRKNRNEQFFFVNNRYIKSNYLNHAVAQAYQQIIPKDSYPFYCVFLEIDPVHVDINIHPTKTEVKFDDERTIYVLLHSLVKRSLGGVHAAPNMDFTDETLKKAIYDSAPKNRDSNLTIGDLRTADRKREPVDPAVWDQLYKREGPAFTPEEPKSEAPLPPSDNVVAQPTLFQTPKAPSKAQAPEFRIFGQWENAYILAEGEGKLYLVNQHRAHQRILYERFLASDGGPKLPSQQLLFPQTFEYSAINYAALQEAQDILNKMGFDMKEFGPNAKIVYGTPAGIPTGQVKDILSQVISDMKTLGTSNVHERRFEGIARAVANRSAISTAKELTMVEMKNMLKDLFQCEVPSFNPSGKPTFKMINSEELQDFFA